jgi:hypothetical protein
VGKAELQPPETLLMQVHGVQVLQRQLTSRITRRILALVLVVLVTNREGKCKVNHKVKVKIKVDKVVLRDKASMETDLAVVLEVLVPGLGALSKIRTIKLALRDISGSLKAPARVDITDINKGSKDIGSKCLG